MEYINYRRFKEQAICGDVNIPALTKFQSIGNIIHFNGEPLCFVTSANAHNFFSRNDDGCGVLRGNLILKIKKLLSRRDDNYQIRWDVVWGDELCRRYRRPEHSDHWLWNHAFYNANIDDLEYIASIVENAR